MRVSRPRRPAGDFLLQPPWAVALIVAIPLGVAYLVVAPQSGDLAAASYRSYLFAHVGLTIWDNGWYGGHYLPGYSLLSPELGAWLGPRLAEVAAAVLAAALFALLIDGHFPARAARLAGAWFALGVGIELASGRVAFDIGLALGLGALVAAARGRRVAALVLGVLSSLGSPVAGAFLGLVCVAWALADLARHLERQRDRFRGTATDASRASPETMSSWRFALALAASALVTILLLTIAFPEGGTQPFAASSFWPEEALVLLIAALVPRHERALRVGVLLYGAALLGAFLIPSAVGENAERLGALAAAPVAACVLLPRRTRVLLALAPALLFWQVISTAEDLAAAASDPSVRQASYTPLLDHLRAIGALNANRPTRIEVVPTLVHWDARWMAPDVAIARGWERQVDRANNSLFYSSAPLSATRYNRWLRSEAISYVALPDAPLDSSGVQEAELLRDGPPRYLREVWHSTHWRLLAVVDAEPLVERPAVVTSMTADAFTITTPQPGTFTVRVRFTPYWALEGGIGCVQRATGGWTEVRARAAGSLHIGIVFAIARIFDDGPRCRGSARTSSAAAPGGRRPASATLGA
jgi:hypothetical protein